jgi:hypothetical protein
MSSGVEFEDSGYSGNYSQVKSTQGGPSYGIGQSSYSSSEVKGMAGWLIRHGFAKSSQGAQLYLVGLVIVNLIITFIALSYLL